MRTTTAAAGATALGTAAAMSIAAFGLPGVATAGATAADRIAALVPVMEVTALLLIGPAIWARAFRAPRFDAFQRVLAITPRGARWAIWTATRRALQSFGAAMGAGLAVWLAAAAWPSGPELRALVATRLVVFALGAFGIALGISASAMLRGRAGAVGLVYGVLVVMAVAPVAMAPVVSLLGAHAGLVRTTMLASPWIVVAGAGGLDLVRMEWMYALSPLGSIEAPYPGVTEALAAYVGGALALLGFAALRLGARWSRLH